MRRGRVAVLVVSYLLGVTGLTVATTSLSQADGTSPTGGALYGFGNNNYGQVGTGDLATPSSPAAVSVSALPAGTSFATISAMGEHSCALTSEGKPYCWGANWQGQLGDGTTTHRSSPTPVSVSALPVQTFIAIAAGTSHTCALTTEGDAYCWGEGSNGRLGTGDTADRVSPTAVNTHANRTFSTITAGDWQTCATTTEGMPYCWGNNTYGQLGDGTVIQKLTPTAVNTPANTSYSAISTSYGSHTCALTTAGIAYCWGNGGNGRLGIGNFSNQHSPTLVSAGGATFSAVSTGRDHTCGLTSTGAPYCWGHGGYGRLGTGNTDQRLQPTEVSSGSLPPGTTFVAISAGHDHTCGLLSTGRPYCWGANTYGQLGDGTTTQKWTPTAVGFEAGSTVSAINAGVDNTLMVTQITPINDARVPTFDTPVATANGLTVNVTNYDPMFTWSITASQGSVTTASATGALWPLTITGLAPGASTTVTVSTTRAGYEAGSATVTGTARTATVDSTPPIPQLLTPDTTRTSTTPPGTTVAPSPTTPSTRTAPPTTTQPPAPTPATNETTDLLPPPSPDTITGLPTRTLIAINNVEPGATVTVTANGFTPNEPVTLVIASTPRIIATGNANTTGTATLTGTIPLDLAPGDHTLAIYAPNSDTGLRQAITVSPPRLPATGTDPTSLLALAMLASGTLLLSLRSWRRQQ